MQAVAWLVDLTHRMRRIAHGVPAGERMLDAVTRAAERELGAPLGVPLGVRTVDAGLEALFLVPRRAAGPGWVALTDARSADPRGFAAYVELMLGGWQPPVGPLDVFHFGNTPELAATLAHLVIKGVKRGTAGWLAAAEREGWAPGRPGLVSIVTDGFGVALCAIQTERVDHLRFGDITEQQAWIEGEGDRTLADWRAGHLAYFSAQAEQFGLAFNDDALVFFEHFRLLTVFGRPDPAS